MINMGKGQVHMEFGTGDINIRSGWTTFNDGDPKMGLVAFRNWTEKMPIGARRIVDETIDIDEYPIFMTFSKVESIDAVIAELENAKAEMLNKD